MGTSTIEIDKYQSCDSSQPFNLPGSLPDFHVSEIPYMTDTVNAQRDEMVHLLILEGRANSEMPCSSRLRSVLVALSHVVGAMWLVAIEPEQWRPMPLLN